LRNFKHQAPSTKHQVPSTKHQAPKTKFQYSSMFQTGNFTGNPKLF